MESTGQLFVLSGPSGVGKSSIREGVRKIFPELAYSISFTTRAPRQGETEGRDYHFVSKDTFVTMKAADAFVEWAQVHGNFYGTSHAQLTKQLNGQQEVLLEIDVKGARQIKDHFPHACFVFVLPPDRETLEKRLGERRTEGRKDIEARLDNASRELEEASWYDYLIVNDVLDEAVEALAAIILSTRFRRQAVLPRVQNMFQPSK